LHCLRVHVLTDHLRRSPLFSYTALPPTITSLLSLHDALPIFDLDPQANSTIAFYDAGEISTTMFDVLSDSRVTMATVIKPTKDRSEEHMSELQSPYDLVCRLLLEKKKNIATRDNNRSQVEQDA